MKKNKYTAPVCEVISVNTESMIASSVLGGDGSQNIGGIAPGEGEFDGEFLSKDKGDWNIW